MPASAFRPTAFATAAALFAGAAPAHAALLLSVDFNAAGNVHSSAYSGVEAQAAAHAAFGSANVWNGLGVTYAAPTLDPAWSGLVDSTGAATGVGLSITGTVGGYSFGPGHDTLRGDFLLFNNPVFSGSGSAYSTVIEFTISGLQAHATYAFYAYGTGANYLRHFDMLLDSNADGDFADETAQAVGSGAADFSTPLDAYFVSVRADAAGNIRGRGVGIDAGPGQAGNAEANWSGFQLVEVAAAPAGSVPEPSTLMLGAAALLAAGGVRRAAGARPSKVRAACA